MQDLARRSGHPAPKFPQYRQQRSRRRFFTGEARALQEGQAPAIDPVARGVVLPFFVREVRSIPFTRGDPKNMQTRIASAGIQARSRLVFVF